MARRRIPMPAVLARLKTAAQAYGAACRDLGEAHATTAAALDVLKEVACHYVELLAPPELDENGNEQAFSEEPVDYQRFLGQIQSELDDDAAAVAAGALQTTGKRG